MPMDEPRIGWGEEIGKEVFGRCLESYPRVGAVRRGLYVGERIGVVAGRSKQFWGTESKSGKSSLLSWGHLRAYCSRNAMAGLLSMEGVS